MRHHNHELDYVIFTLIVVFGGPFLIWLAWHARRSVGAKQLLTARGFVFDADGHAHIEIERIRVEAQVRRDNRGKTYDLELRLPPAPRPLRLGRGLARRDVAIGDAYFDDEVVLDTTEPGHALVFLSHESRRAIVRAVRLGARFDGVRWVAGADAIIDAGADRFLDALVAARRAMAEPTPLEDLARSDPSPKVRLAALRHLAVAAPELLQALESDLDPEVRLEASLRRGAEGRAGLARLMVDGSRTWRVRAAMALASEPGPHALAVEKMLTAALDDPLLADQASAALAALRARRGVEAAGRLALADPTGGEVSES